MNAIANGEDSNFSPRGKPHIVYPIEKYIRIRRNIAEKISLFMIFGVSVSFNCSSFFEGLAFLSSTRDAVYPALITAAIISSLDEFIDCFDTQDDEQFLALILYLCNYSTIIKNTVETLVDKCFEEPKPAKEEKSKKEEKPKKEKSKKSEDK